MRILPWRARPAHRPARSRTLARLAFPAIGEYAGRARYLPGDSTRLTPRLRQALGRVLELRFAGLAPAGPWAGQSLYREDDAAGLLGAAIIPEQDLDFIGCRPMRGELD